MNCEFCQSPAHVWFQCPKKPEGWKPVRLSEKSQVEKSALASLSGPEQSELASGIEDQAPENQSTAARKDVQVIEVGQRPVKAGESQNIAVSPKDRDMADHAATTEKTGSRYQALPVDTNPSLIDAIMLAASPKPSTSLAGVEGDKTGANSGSEAQVDERGSPKPEDDGSRPSTSAKFDKVAYQREYMRKRRAAQKAAK